MTPKEKAEELVGQFSWIDCSSDAKQCALICVDEMLNMDLRLFDIIELQEIKKEIKKL